jgi:hypothetical protein
MTFLQYILIDMDENVNKNSQECRDKSIYHGIYWAREENNAVPKSVVLKQPYFA